MSQFNLKSTSFLGPFCRKPICFFSARLLSSSASRSPELYAAEFVSKSIDTCRKTSLAITSEYPPHIVELISDDLKFGIVRTFIIDTIFSRLWKIDTFEADAELFIQNMWFAVLALDSSYKLSKGRSAPHLYKYMDTLTKSLCEA